jgi:hypothetical protein
MLNGGAMRLDHMYKKESWYWHAGGLLNNYQNRTKAGWNTVEGMKSCYQIRSLLVHGE